MHVWQIQVCQILPQPLIPEIPDKYLTLSAKSRSLESSVPVFETKDSVARNWTCATTTADIAAAFWAPAIPP